MKPIRAYPPNWTRIAAVFPVKGKQGIIYAYGDRLYNPSGVALTPWIIAHELVHGTRQGKDAAVWWDRYLTDKDFRLEEELLAHIAEYKEYLKHHDDAKYNYLDTIARRLSSPLYGSMLTLGQAFDKIWLGAKA